MTGHIGWMNDEAWRHLTPEQRWMKCLAWVESKIVAALRLSQEALALEGAGGR